MPKVKYMHRVHVFNAAAGIIFIFLVLFSCAGRLSAAENIDVRLKAIDNKLKEIEASQNQVVVDQESMLERIKTLKIWARRKGGGRAP